MDPQKIRNFCIIAHIDHGKSTLADRLLDATGSISTREKKEQFLDNLSIERERGITIKAQTVSLQYTYQGETYLLNLIDTPGHVDFSYEVSRSIAACEGALLVVDASQGVQAQTLANVYMAVDHNLEILPVINKIDLPQAEPERVLKEIEDVIGLDTTNAVMVSAKTGFGVDKLLEKVVENFPPPKADATKPLRALIFDSWFDAYLGVVVLFRIFEGQMKKGDRLKFMATKKDALLITLGKHTPFKTDFESLQAGEVGFMSASIKNLSDIRIGDTITLYDNPAKEALPGYAEAKSMVFSGIYPVSAEDYENLKDALAKLILNDSSIHFEPETSVALGFGFRCGFLGLLHLEIVQERLEKEFHLNLILTSPTVVFKVIDQKDKETWIENPSKLPNLGSVKQLLEPYVLGTILIPKEYIGAMIQLALEKRGIQKSIEYLGLHRAMMKFELPLSEIVLEFYDQLKTLSKGYASFDYEFLEYRPADLVKLDIFINGDVVDALSLIVHREKAYYKARDLTKKLKELIPRQMFEIAIQASLGAKIIARESIPAMRKNVTAKCYGGDITRKRKLLEKQKEGKKRMKQIGSVEVPQEAFMAILKLKS